ncbi:MAG: homoprotocatechuate degradation operon regulator HpaR [Gammaproteobacteria bacterium]|nr:homoprotocatechuate degradation operon regulator HpaR [Gammaproteobacteria bacterium]
MLDFEHSLPVLLLRAREVCMARFRPILGRYGITEQQWRVIRALAEFNGQELAELAERTLILRPSMTGIIDRLERDELVVRKKDSQDGRKTCIWLSRKARRLYDKIMPEVASEYSLLQEQFSEKSWDDLYTSLFQLIKMENSSVNNR